MITKIENSSKNNRLIFVVIPFCLFALNIILKSIFLRHIQIGLDEPFTIWHAQMPMGKMISQLSKTDLTPPFYEILLHLWIKVFGSSAFAVRLPSMLFISLSSILVYVIGRRIFGWRSGLVAAILFSLCNQFTYFSQEARCYGLLTLVGLLSILLLLVWSKNNKLITLLLLLLVNIILLYIHYFGAVLLLIELIWITFGSQSKKIKITFLCSIIFAFISFIPQIIILFSIIQQSGGRHWVPPSSITEFYVVIAKYNNQPVSAVASLVIFAIGLTSFIFKKRWQNLSKSNYVFLLLLIFPTAYIVIFIMGFRLPVFTEKYTSICFPYYFILTAGLLESGYKKKYAYILWSVLIGTMLFTANLNPNKNSNWRDVAAFVKTKNNASTAILISNAYSDLNFIYHYDLNIFNDWKNTKKRMQDNGIIGLSAAGEQSILNLQNYSCIIFIEVGNTPLSSFSNLQQEIDKNFELNETNNEIHGMHVYQYLHH